MIDDALISRLTADMRRLYAADPPNAPRKIESHLHAALADRAPGEARAVIGRVLLAFAAQETPAAEVAADQAALARVSRLLLGRDVSCDDLSPAELLERLAQSLNTIFDALNELIGVINMSFNGGAAKGEQTIRQVIGVHLDGQDQTQPLEAYLGSIKTAFLTAQEAFKKAAWTKVGQILQTLDPDKLAAERSGGLKIGPLRKAEDFDILKEKIERIRRWFESGRFMEDYLREFEKNCQTLNQ